MAHFVALAPLSASIVNSTVPSQLLQKEKNGAAYLDPEVRWPRVITGHMVGGEEVN